jgi:Holliday junction resolvase RusA-like endonuclease
MVEISLTFYMARPLSHFTGRNRERKLKDNLEERPSLQRRDLDNMIKFCLDALQGVMLVNDDCVQSIHADMPQKRLIASVLVLEGL